VRCEPGEIYLRRIHCGRRSPGWALSPGEQHAADAKAAAAKQRAAAGKPTARPAAPVVASV
jgi:hypothetical protein